MDKFAARWHQLKPKEESLDGDPKKAMKSLEFIKEKQLEFTELTETHDKIMYVFPVLLLLYIHAVTIECLPKLFKYCSQIKFSGFFKIYFAKLEQNVC